MTNIKYSQSKTENGNTFIAYSAEIADMAQIQQVMRILYDKKEIETTTSNSVAYRFRKGDKLVERWKDDGERGSGRAIMEVLHAHAVENMMVVVSRHFISHIGPMRFNIIKQCTFEVVQQFMASISNSISHPITNIFKGNRRQFGNIHKGGLHTVNQHSLFD